MNMIFKIVKLCLLAIILFPVFLVFIFTSGEWATRKFELGATKTTTKIPLLGGHELIVKKTETPAFIKGQPIVTERLTIRWASGRVEKLPFFLHKEISSVVEADGYVFLLAGKTLVYRSGTIASVRDRWVRFDISNVINESFRSYFEEYAKEHGDAETRWHLGHETLYYSTRAGLGLTSGHFHIPHRIDSIDPITFQIRMSREIPGSKAFVAVPRHLIFSVTPSSNLSWTFDAAASKDYEGQFTLDE